MKVFLNTRGMDEILIRAAQQAHGKIIKDEAMRGQARLSSTGTGRQSKSDGREIEL